MQYLKQTHRDGEFRVQRSFRTCQSLQVTRFAQDINSFWNGLSHMAVYTRQAGGRPFSQDVVHRDYTQNPSSGSIRRPDCRSAGVRHTCAFSAETSHCSQNATVITSSARQPDTINFFGLKTRKAASILLEAPFRPRLDAASNSRDDLLCLRRIPTRLRATERSHNAF